MFYLCVIFYCVVHFSQTTAAPCGATAWFGEEIPGQNVNSIGSNTGYGYMSGDTTNIINCCGIAEGWAMEFKNVPGGGQDIYFQIWRPTTGTNLELVGDFLYTATADVQTTHTIPIADQIDIQEFDRIGWWTAGVDIITHKTGPAQTKNDLFSMPLTDRSVGDIVDWGSINTDQTTFSLRLDVGPGNIPTFTNLAAFSILNTETVGTSLLTVGVTDADAAQIATLTTAMTAHPKFSFDASTNILSVGSVLTGAATLTETLTFTVTDDCGNVGTDTLAVNITNPSPTIDNLPEASIVSEDVSVKTLLHTIVATDPGDTVRCYLATPEPGFSVTQIASTTDFGIYADGTPAFVYTSINTYILDIECTDEFNIVSSTYYVYLTKNAAPVITNLQNSATVSTSAGIGDTVFTVISTDSENDALTYTMTCDPVPCPFEIRDSGAIQVNADISTHTVVGYDIYITVSDAKNTVRSNTLTVTITDINDPVAISNLPLGSTLAIKEHTALNSDVYTVLYADLDTSQSHTWTMASSPATGLNYFSISSTGVVQTSGTLTDYETLSGLSTTTFTLDIQVNDPLSSDTQQLVLEIININEAPTFSQAAYSLTTTEGLAGADVGTPVFGITDPDTVDTATLTMDCSTYSGYFIMNPTTGAVTLQADYDLDTGTRSAAVPCTVTVTDSGSLTDTALLTINIDDVNDNTPVFSPTIYTFYVNYYTGTGTVVGTITATDSDYGNYGTIAYYLDQSSLGAEHFTVASSGVITIKDVPQGSSVGYANTVAINATAVDTGGKFDTATILMVISDTTTVGTTTTTARYREFFEDPKNIYWIVATFSLLLVILVTTIYVWYTCTGSKGCAQCKKECCRKTKKRVRARYRPRRGYHPRPDIAPTPPAPAPIISTTSIRQPPPPVGAQAWRSGH